VTDTIELRESNTGSFYRGTVTVESVSHGSAFANLVVVDSNGERFVWRRSKTVPTKAGRVLLNPGDSCYAKYRIACGSRYSLREISHMKIINPDASTKNEK